ncbi:hypothetical protein [Caballeronia cordobensis]|nr:hypothetical protein [Caballeronia cordobensis]
MLTLDDSEFVAVDSEETDVDIELTLDDMLDEVEAHVVDNEL